jgi:hypothetical protein
MRGISKLYFEKDDKNFDHFRTWIQENGQKIGKWENIKLNVGFFGPKNEETKKIFSFRSNENHMDDFFLFNNQIIHTDNNFSEILSKFDEFSNRLM